MKTLGLLGGMSWESTTSYYQLLNRLARARLGGQHSAKLLVWSGDFATIAAMQAAGEWDEATAVLVEAARKLEGAGAEALLICANTMHLMASQVQEAVGIPVLHVADATALALKANGARRPLLLATRFTMERDFYRDRLMSHGVGTLIPPTQDRLLLHAIIFDELIQGRFEPSSRAAMIAIAERAMVEAGADSVILGCTEFGLLVRPGDFRVPVFDTTELHATAAMDFALSS
jgi:aspartate racemase